MDVQIDEVAFFVLHDGRLEVKVGVESSLVLLGVVEMRRLQRNLSSCWLSGFGFVGHVLRDRAS